MSENGIHRLRGILVKSAGIALLVLCLVFLGRALAQLDLERLVETMGWNEWLVTGLAAIAYSGCLALLALAWSAMAACDREIRPIEAIAIYGPGVVAKYLPGSVLQYASRQLIGSQHGMQHGAMAKASLFEAVLHVIVSLAIALLLIAGGGFTVLAACFTVAAVIALRPSSRQIAAISLQLLFFCAFAAIVVFTGSIGVSAEDPERLAGLFLLAWAAGFLVPIAPGGIGVREAAFLAIATPFETVDAIMLVALLTRLVTIAGDGVMGVVGYWAAAWLARREKMQASG